MISKALTPVTQSARGFIFPEQMVRPQLSYMEKQHGLPTVSQFCFLLTLKLLFDKQVCSVW